MPGLIENKFGLTVELHDFSQAQYEVYEPAVIKAVRDNTYEIPAAHSSTTAQALVRGASVRAAIKAGFLTGITAEGVDQLSPRAVTWLAEKVAQHVREVTSPLPDPNSSSGQQTSPTT